jgi:hypothetical protein
MGKLKKFQFWYLIWPSIILLITGLTIHNRFEVSKLKREGKIVVCHTLKTWQGYRGGINISYSYYSNNTFIKKSDWIDINSKYKLNFQNKYFLLIYLPDDIEKHRILVTPKDYENFDLIYPDSLNWVRDLLEK